MPASGGTTTFLTEGFETRRHHGRLAHSRCQHSHEQLARTAQTHVATKSPQHTLAPTTARIVLVAHTGLQHLGGHSSDSSFWYRATYVNAGDCYAVSTVDQRHGRSGRRWMTAADADHGDCDGNCRTAHVRRFNLWYLRCDVRRTTGARTSTSTTSRSVEPPGRRREGLEGQSAAQERRHLRGPGYWWGCYNPLPHQDRLQHSRARRASTSPTPSAGRHWRRRRHRRAVHELRRSELDRGEELRPGAADPRPRMDERELTGLPTTTDGVRFAFLGNAAGRLPVRR